MKRVILLIPFLGLTAFGCYYQLWERDVQARLARQAREPLAVYAERDGRSDAETDLARGVVRLINREELAAAPEYRELLARLYRIEAETISDPERHPALQRYAADYNHVMLRHIAFTYGTGVFRETQEIARRLHEVRERIRDYVPPV